MPSTSAVNNEHGGEPGPSNNTGLQGDSVLVLLSGPGLQYWVEGIVEPFLVSQAGFTYS